jgi:hypothetical protein
VSGMLYRLASKHACLWWPLRARDRWSPAQSCWYIPVRFESTSVLSSGSLEKKWHRWFTRDQVGHIISSRCIVGSATCPTLWSGAVQCGPWCGPLGKRLDHCSWVSGTSWVCKVPLVHSSGSLENGIIGAPGIRWSSSSEPRMSTPCVVFVSLQRRCCKICTQTWQTRAAAVRGHAAA